MGLGLDEALMWSCAAGEIQHGFSVSPWIRLYFLYFFVGKYELMSSKLGKGLAGSKRCSLCFSCFSVCSKYVISTIYLISARLCQI